MAQLQGSIQRRSSGQRKQTAERETGKVVIGENMKNRVIPYAEQIGAKYYQPRSKIPANWMENNRRWIREQMKKGKVIIDLGPDPKRPFRSPYYEMERREIEKVGYPVIRP